MATTVIPDSPAIVPMLKPARDLHARFSREAYHRLIHAGLVDPDSRVELIDGEIFMMLPIGPPQGSLITRLDNFFVRCLSPAFDCRNQLPIIAGDHSEPEPDIAIVRHREDDYKQVHPSPSDVVLLIEVAQASLDFDLGPKLRLYAISGISEYWVVDVKAKSLLVHRNPSGEAYDDVTTVQSGTSVSPIAAPECRMDVDWLFR